MIYKVWTLLFFMEFITYDIMHQILDVIITYLKHVLTGIL